MKIYKLTEQVEKWREEKKNLEREVGSFARESLQEAEDIMEELLDKIEENREEALRLDKMSEALYNLKRYLFLRVVAENQEKFETDFNTEITYDSETKCLYEVPFL